MGIWLFTVGKKMTLRVIPDKQKATPDDLICRTGERRWVTRFLGRKMMKFDFDSNSP